MWSLNATRGLATRPPIGFWSVAPPGGAKKAKATSLRFPSRISGYIRFGVTGNPSCAALGVERIVTTKTTKNMISL